MCVLKIVRPGMEESESAEKQENTGIGPASACAAKEEGYCAERSDTDRTYSCRVMRGLDPRIHLLREKFHEDGWIAGSSPAMTAVLDLCPERNQQLCEMAAGAASLFPACYLQGMVQLQRVGPPGPMWHH